MIQPNPRKTDASPTPAPAANPAAAPRALITGGAGRQVRDLLFIDDLVQAMCAAIQGIDVTAGHAFNIGGGPGNSVSLLELMDLITRLHGHRPQLTFAPWHLGDQRYYVSDTSRFTGLTGWRPRTNVGEGVARLYDWIRHLEQAPDRAPSTIASRS